MFYTSFRFYITRDTTIRALIPLSAVFGVIGKVGSRVVWCSIASVYRRTAVQSYLYCLIIKFVKL